MSGEPEKRNMKVVPEVQPVNDDEEDGEGIIIADERRCLHFPQQETVEDCHPVMGAATCIPQEETQTASSSSFVIYSDDSPWESNPNRFSPQGNRLFRDVECDFDNEQLYGNGYGIPEYRREATAMLNVRTKSEEDLAYALELQASLYTEEGGEQGGLGEAAAALPESKRTAAPRKTPNKKQAGSNIALKQSQQGSVDNTQKKNHRLLPPIPSNGTGNSQVQNQRLVIHRKTQENKKKEQQEKLDHELAAQLESEEETRPPVREPGTSFCPVMFVPPELLQHQPIHYEGHHERQRLVRLARPAINARVPMGRDGGILSALLARRRGEFHVLLPGNLEEDSADGDSYEALLALEERLGEVKKRGLDDRDFDRLPTSKYNEEMGRKTGNTVCKVCLENFKSGQELRTLPCVHYFHLECIDHWLKINGVCPVCRLEVKDQLKA